MTNLIQPPYTPQPRQQLLHETTARQILYGGSAGGGKSYSLRWDAIRFCLDNPGCQAYLFRRTYEELASNHIYGPNGIVSQCNGIMGTWVQTSYAFNFLNGSSLYFRYCEKDEDVTRYQGAEMHWVGIDEATHLTPYRINYLKSRNRLGSWRPTKDVDRLPRFVMASNPGGPAHSYLKAIFLDQAPPETIFYDREMRDPDKPDDPGWSTVFIPAKMADNRYLDENYGASFGGMPPELARALREGDWDAVVGQALHTLSRERHMLRQFVPPRHWQHFMVIDWGSVSPFSVGWYVVSEGAGLGARENWPERWMPAGAVIRYAELYGWNGKPNQGARLSAQQVARKIIMAEENRNDPPMDYRVGDTEMWAQKGGPSIQEWFLQVDERLAMRRAEKDRKRNYQEVLARLAGNPRYLEDGSEEEDPMFFVTANCTHFWRTVPTLVLDETDPEKGPETKNQEDHCLWGETILYTDKGPFDIEDLVDSGARYVWTHAGWAPFVNLGMTARDAEIWTLRLADGQVIHATPSHRFLCLDNRYRRLDELTYEHQILCHDLPSSVRDRWRNTSSAVRTGNVGVTIRDVASAFTGLCGSIITAPFRRASTFITSMATLRTTLSTTLSYYLPRRTSSTTQTTPGTSSTPNGTWRSECAPGPWCGTGPQRGGNGTPLRDSAMARFRRVSRLYVSSVADRILLSRETVSTAQMPVSSEHFGVGILDIIPNSKRGAVYNIHVPGINAFVVAGGAVVHNCYDEVAYALRSRPYVVTADDRYYEQFGDEIRRARGKSADPYAT